jgi:HSP20 family protein
MSGLNPAEELKRLQKRMNRLIEDLGLTELESKYLDEMQKMQKRMGDLMEDVETSGKKGDISTPLADVMETDDTVVITMDLPGVEKQDVDIAIMNDELHVAASRETETDVIEKDYHKRERIHKKFERIVKLPVPVKMEEAKASLSNGVLKITLPKEVVASRKRINIE